MDAINMQLKATSCKPIIDRQATQVAKAERAAKEILVGTETAVNVKRSRRSKMSKLN
jgi:hypothetical protein